MFISTDYAALKGCWVVVFIFIQIVIEHSVSKQCIPCLHMYHKKGAWPKWVNKFPTTAIKISRNPPIKICRNKESREINKNAYPLYSDGFTHTCLFSKYGIVHCVLKGVTCRISTIMVYLCPGMVF